MDRIQELEKENAELKKNIRRFILMAYMFFEEKWFAEIAVDLRFIYEKYKSEWDSIAQERSGGSM